jgi:Tol biopolymer transport system component
MPQTISVAELASRGVDLTAFEAVAIARALIHAAPVPVDSATLVGPPTLSTVRLAEDGSVSCSSCGIAPSVAEVAILLNEMLQQSGAKAGGGLRYAIARALLQVDAPPFESAAAFSRALQRHGEGEPQCIVRDVWNRATSRAAAPPPPHLPRPDRRHSTVSVTQLRRELREADRRIYELLNAREPNLSEGKDGPRRILPWRGLTLAGLILTAVAGLTIVTRTPQSPDPSETSRTASMSPVMPASRDYSPSPSPEPRPSARPRGRGRLPADPVVTAPPAATVRTLDSGDPMFSPSFAADGSAMFYHTGLSASARSALMKVEDVGPLTPVGDDLRVVTIVEDGANNFHVRPSPDGSRIAFDSDRDGERGVYVAAIDGSDVTRVSGPGYAAVPTWSPDGERLAFVRGEPDRPRVWNLWLHSLTTGDTRRITSFRFGQTWGASWFPNGQQVVYSHEDRLFVHNLESGDTRQYASPMAGRLVRTPAVSPDGERVIFQVARHGAWLLDLSDGSMRVVLSDPTAEEFAWSPDGRRVAFHSKRDGGWSIWFTAGS